METSSISSPPPSSIPPVDRNFGTQAALLFRKVQVFGTAARVFADYKILKWRCDQMDEGTDESREIVDNNIVDMVIHIQKR